MGAIMAVTMDHSRGMAQATLVPTIVATAINVAIVSGVMSLFKSDPAANQYGPPTGGTGPSDGFE